jgi:hypothetical protein
MGVWNELTHAERASKMEATYYHAMSYFCSVDKSLRSHTTIPLKWLTRFKFHVIVDCVYEVEESCPQHQEAWI